MIIIIIIINNFPPKPQSAGVSVKKAILRNTLVVSLVLWLGFRSFNVPPDEEKIFSVDSQQFSSYLYYYLLLIFPSSYSSGPIALLLISPGNIFLMKSPHLILMMSMPVTVRLTWSPAAAQSNGSSWRVIPEQERDTEIGSGSILWATTRGQGYITRKWAGLLFWTLHSVTFYSAGLVRRHGQQSFSRLNEASFDFPRHTETGALIWNHTSHSVRNVITDPGKEKKHRLNIKQGTSACVRFEQMLPTRNESPCQSLQHKKTRSKNQPSNIMQQVREISALL